MVKLQGGVDEGYPSSFKTYSKGLAKALKINIAEFSAFKETSFKSVLEASLVDSAGELLAWDNFKKLALEVSGEYNTRWLETEYQQTVATATMAGKWNDYQGNKELYPNLQYVTAGDDRVRAEHAVWDGVIKPINDPWWDDHLPPNDWGCRCDVIQTDDDVTDKPTGGTQIKIEFENNAGKTGKIFPISSYEENLTKTEQDEAMKNLDDWT